MKDMHVQGQCGNVIIFLPCLPHVTVAIGNDDAIWMLGSSHMSWWLLGNDGAIGCLVQTSGCERKLHFYCEHSSL